MKVIELKYTFPKIYIAALDCLKRQGIEFNDDVNIGCFDFSDTEEGFDFWYAVDVERDFQKALEIVPGYKDSIYGSKIFAEQFYQQTDLHVLKYIYELENIVKQKQ